jgi:F-type H+-transporting ATPase subunit gamma
MKVIVLGRKGRDTLRKRYADRMVAAHTDLGGRPQGTFTDRIGAELLDGFRDGRYSRVLLCYAHYISTASNRPMVEQYLPFEAAAFGAGENGEATQIDYLLEPSPEEVFEAVLPLYLRRKLFLTLAEAMTSEYASRMMAMNNATKNCDELTGSLTLRLNKARQAAITTEIIEIVSGAQALTG